MSHLKERKDKNCLNCNAEVQGKFCHICGQENIEPVESVWHLVTHFFQDITHFDGKFFSTGRYLLLKPGFLSKEYMMGRRASYLNPIRMYVFTSAFFFLIFFNLFDENDRVGTAVNGKTLQEIERMDSVSFRKFTLELNPNGMTREGFKHYIDSINSTRGIHFTTSKYKSKAEYDSVLKAGYKKHNWLERKMIYKEIEMNEKYNNDQGKILKAFSNILIHSFPQMLFISLPIFALILKLLYTRRKQFYYGHHAIFAIHLYVFFFLIMLMIIGLQKIGNFTSSSIIDYVQVLFVLYILFYEYKALRIFYEQRRGKTILKFILLNLAHVFVIVFLIVLFTFFSILKV